MPKIIEEAFLKVSIPAGTHEHKSYFGRRITTNYSFFKEGIVLDYVDEEKMIFRRPDIDFMGKVCKVSKKGNQFIFHVSADIPAGIFTSDVLETDEDSMSIYFKKQ